MAGRTYVRSKPKRHLLQDPDRTQRAAELGLLFRQIGDTRGNQFPWHKTREPFEILVAEYLLSRTARNVVERVFSRLFGQFPDAEALASASPGELASITHEAGLPRKTRGLIEMAKQVSEAGGVRAEREWLLSLPFVGDYIADAVLLYAFEQTVVPLDRNFQRIVHRVFLGQEPPRRSVEPYRDPETVYIVDEMTDGFDAPGLRAFHQGVLTVAWDFCRYHPRINACPLQVTCVLARSIGAD